MLLAAIILAVPLVGIMWGVWEICEILSKGRVQIKVYNKLKVTILKPEEIEVTFNNAKEE